MSNADRESLTYNKEELERGIKALSESETDGVKGVKVIKGNKSGPSDPVLYLGTLTHGGERMSAAPVAPLLDGRIELISGKVIMGVNNMAAAAKKIRREEGDFDFNRLPNDDILASAHEQNPSVAVQRMRALSRIWGGVTHGLDNHMVTATPVSAMKLHEKGDSEFANSIGIRSYITRITEFQGDPRNPTGPYTTAFGNYIGGLDNPIPVAEIEGGGPESVEVYDSVLRGTLSVMAQLGMIDPERYGLHWTEIDQQRYDVAAWGYAPAGYAMAKPFGAYSRVEKGEVVMEDLSGQGRDPIIAPFDSHLIMPPPYSTTTGKRHILDEPDDWWYSTPVKTERVRVL